VPLRLGVLRIVVAVACVAWQGRLAAMAEVMGPWMSAFRVYLPLCFRDGIVIDDMP